MDSEGHDKVEERKLSTDPKLKIGVIKSMTEVGEQEWNLCNAESAGEGLDNPFLDWAFLHALEASGSACEDSGWVPWHIVARDESGKLVGCVPLYLKGHSYGEYVFDHSWARAYRAFSRQPYYPKLQSCVPFTPVTGPRLMARGETEQEKQAVTRALARAISSVCDQTGASSAHVTFPQKSDWAAMGGEGFLQRTGIQYHWLNDGFKTFDDFLATLKQSRRKNIRQERKKIAKAGLRVQRLRGAEIQPRHWDAFYSFYTNTVDEKWGQAYLTRNFFELLGEHMADKVMLIVAEEEGSGQLVAGALNLIGGDCLYGRNWGCIKKYDSLHFELCYYQAIEAAIGLGLQRVEAGAQGEHKISRGYLPTFTYSAHYIRDPNFRTAVEEALQQEREQVIYTTAMLTIQESPFKASPETHLSAHGIEIRRREESERGEEEARRGGREEDVQT